MAAGIYPSGVPRKTCACSTRYLACSCSWSERIDEMPSGLKEEPIMELFYTGDVKIFPGDKIVVGKVEILVGEVTYELDGQVKVIPAEVIDNR